MIIPIKQANDFTLKEAIQEFLNLYRLDDKLLEQQVIRAWPEVMGKLISNHTKDLYIRNKILYVKLDSAPLRNEMSFAREKICKALNRAVKSDVIRDVVIR